MERALVDGRSGEVLAAVLALKHKEQLPNFPENILPAQGLDLLEKRHEQKEVEAWIGGMPIDFLAEAVDVHFGFLAHLVRLLVNVVDLAAVKALADEVRVVQHFLALRAAFDFELVEVVYSIIR